MKKIKRFQGTFAVTQELYEQLKREEYLEKAMKGEAVQRLAEDINKELEHGFFVESNPLIGERCIYDITAMSTYDWQKIERFLMQNNFDFNNL